MDEDYPIVRLEEPATGNIFYCRTTNWDSVRVGDNGPQTVDFTLNSAVTPGSYELTVVGAGIASQPVRIRIMADELVENEEATAQLPTVSSGLERAPTKLMRVPKPIHPQH
jgi:hypothetical protein